MTQTSEHTVITDRKEIEFFLAFKKCPPHRQKQILAEMIRTFEKNGQKDNAAEMRQTHGINEKEYPLIA